MSKEMYVTDKKGNRYEIKSHIDYGAIIMTSVLPELKPIDSLCIARDGLIFGKWRDPDYRNSAAIDDCRMLKWEEFLRQGWLLPEVDKIYGFVHPNNVASIKWVLSRGGYLDGKHEIDGVIYDKYVVPIDAMVKMAEKIKCMV